MSEWLSDFLSFAPNTLGGDWAWVTLSWLLTLVGFAGYQLYLVRSRRRLAREASE